MKSSQQKAKYRQKINDDCPMTCFIVHIRMSEVYAENEHSSLRAYSLKTPGKDETHFSIISGKHLLRIEKRHGNEIYYRHYSKYNGSA